MEQTKIFRETRIFEVTNFRQSVKIRENRENFCTQKVQLLKY